MRRRVSVYAACHLLGFGSARILAAIDSPVRAFVVTGRAYIHDYSKCNGISIGPSGASSSRGVNRRPIPSGASELIASCGQPAHLNEILPMTHGRAERRGTGWVGQSGEGDTIARHDPSPVPLPNRVRDPTFRPRPSPLGRCFAN